MRYAALATDYDGTLADEGRVSADAVAALEMLRASGRQLLLVTGREIEDLRTVFEALDLFDYIVAENGGVLYQPRTGGIEPLAPPPNERLVAALAAQGIEPLHAGHVVIATQEPHDAAALQAIRELGLEMQLVFNKGSVMMLPSGVNKATGLGAALHRMGLVPHNVVGIGDAENDHAFLRICEASVATANAVPALIEGADFVTSGGAGIAVIEICHALIDDDLRFLEPRLTRHRVTLGIDERGEPVSFAPYGRTLLVTGSSGAGKSTLTMGLLERLAGLGYEFCLIDPEGDYPVFGDATLVGSRQYPPVIEDIVQAMERVGMNVIVNMLAVPLADRPAFFEQITLRVRELQGRVARPHWLVVDEAHHMLSPEAVQDRGFPQVFGNLVLITPHAQMLAREAFERVDTLIAVGTDIPQTVGALGTPLGIRPPGQIPDRLADGEAYVWWPRDRSRVPQRVQVQRSELDRRRHERKYAEGDLGEARSFYFRGPRSALNLRAQNLMLFLQIAEGVDEETWLYHFDRGDYSRWFREMIKDEDLAREVQAIEATPDRSVVERRALIRDAVEARYTLPGTAPTGSSQVAPE